MSLYYFKELAYMRSCCPPSVATYNTISALCIDAYTMEHIDNDYFGLFLICSEAIRYSFIHAL